jgi:hypothetical protein
VNKRYEGVGKTNVLTYVRTCVRVCICVYVRVSVIVIIEDVYSNASMRSNKRVNKHTGMEGERESNNSVQMLEEGEHSVCILTYKITTVVFLVMTVLCLLPPYLLRQLL